MKKLLPLALLLLASPALADETPPGATTIDAAGNMEFQVKGETALRLSPQDGVCDASSLGAIRFNKTTKSFEGCDGESGWKGLGGSSSPVGSFMWYAGANCPDGYVAAGGTVLSGSTTAALAAVLGTTYGAYGQLPDLRGLFIRGIDGGRGLDPTGAARTLGSYQADEFKSHVHPGIPYNHGTAGNSGGKIAEYHGTWNTGTAGGAETRPKNIAMLPCIKY